VMLTNANFIYGSEVFRAATGLRNEDRHLIALPPLSLRGPVPCPLAIGNHGLWCIDSVSLQCEPVF